MWSFNAQQVAPSAGFEPPSDNWHTVIIVDPEMKPTKDGQGGFLSLPLSIVSEGADKGKKFHWNLNLFNANPQTVSIAQGELSAVCHVVGQYQIDQNTLHLLANKPFQVKTQIRTDDPRYCNVTGVRDVNGNEPGKAGAGPQPAQPPQPAQHPGQWQTGPAQSQPPAQPAAQPPAQAPQTGGQPPWGAPAPGTEQAPPAQPQQPQPANQPPWGAPQPAQPAQPQPGNNAPPWAQG